MVEIPGVYIPIRGDYKQLPGDMAKARQIVTESAQGMSKALDGVLSPRTISTGVNKLIDNLGQLSRSSKITGSDFSKLGVDLKQLQGITGLTAGSFQKLQERALQVQGYRAQEKALRDIAKAADLTNKEIRTLGAQFGVSHSSINRVVSATNSGSTGMKGMAVAAGSLVGQMALMVGGLYAGQAAIGAITGEFKRGLQSIEDFNLTVAASAAYITTFSAKAKAGDLAGAFEEANVYAGQLATKLEMIDSQTIASGKDLQTMSETFIQHGVLLDINNKKQVEGFTNIATALALVTAGQNKDIQMRQEINALLLGQIRATDRLPKLLKNIDPELENHLVLWKQEGTLIENVGKLLQGFAASTGKLDDLWTTVGSTMETIHNRILRGAFKPIFEDLIALAKDFNQSLQDTEGNLTPLAKGLQKLVSEGYEKGKEGLDAFDDGVLKLIYDFNLLTVGVRVFQKVVGGIKGAIEDFGSTDIEKAKNEIEELKASLTHDKAWYEFSFLPDPKEENRRAEEIKGKISELQKFIVSSENELAELRRKSSTSDGPASAPTLSKSIAADLEEQEKLAKKSSQIAERRADEQKRLYEQLTDTIAKEGMSQTQIELYELNKRYQANLKVAGDNIQLQKLATKAYENELKKRSAADKDYNAGWSAFQNRQQQQFVDGWQGAADRRKEAEDEANRDIIDSHQGATSVIVSEWSNAYGSIQSSLATMIKEMDFSLDSIVDIVKTTLSEILAAILMSGIKQAFLNLFGGDATTSALGGLFSGVAGAIGKGGNSSTPSVGTTGAANWGNTLGGTVALAGGAYGMYAGAKNIKEGNAGVGAVQTGLGAYSAYKGAVTLGLLEKGAATEAAKIFAAKLGYAATQTGVGTVATESTFAIGKGAVAAQTTGTGTGSAAGASASSYGASAAGAAAYAVPIAAAILVAKGIWDKSQRPDSEVIRGQRAVNETGITPGDLGAFHQGWTDIRNTVLSSIPVIGEYKTALYDASSQILVAKTETGTLALAFNASAEAGRQWATVMASGNETINDSIIAADQFSASVGVSGEGMGKAAEYAYIHRDSMNALSDALNGSADAAAFLRGEENGLAFAANSAAEETKYMAGMVQTMGAISQQAANKIGDAWSSIEGLSADAKSFGGYVVGPSDGKTSFHAEGGIFTRPARIGSHVFGESGMEALIPLPGGPDVLSKLIDRLDRIERNQSSVGSGGMLQPIIFSIGGQEIKRVVVPIIDEHVTPKARRNQLGERTAYAPR